MTDRDQEISDVLRKAGEDVQQGMWCQASWFTDKPGIHDDGLSWAPEEVFDFGMSVERLSKYYRCAEGSIILATRIAGLELEVYEAAVGAVDYNLTECCEQCRHSSTQGVAIALHEHNDLHMDGMDPFEAGHHLSEIFRDTADRLIR